MKRLFDTAIASVLTLSLLIVILLVPLTYKRGVNGIIKTYNIPLYAKLGGFLYRDYEYRRLSREITTGINDDEKKVLAIYKWTVEHIKKNKPQDWPVMDDHILDIIIRGYGESDQMADVFTTLCTYSGIPAFRDVYHVKDSVSNKRIASLVLSFVRVGGRWLVFDLFNRKYFVKDNGKIASVDELLKDPHLVEKGAGDFEVSGVGYSEFFKMIKNMDIKGCSRPEEQMVGRRLMFEINKVWKR